MSETSPNLGRHKRTCTICAHDDVQEIEAAFIAWRSPTAIAEDFGLSDRSSVYRHAHALDLFPRRRKNIRAALEKIIERAGDVEVTASAVVAAIQAYAKINSSGEWVEKIETVSMDDLYAQMTSAELDRYATHNELPGWFRAKLGATHSDSHETVQ